MLSIPLLYVRQKQAFRKDGGILRLLGNPVEVAKRLKGEGYKLLHIVDMDALTGLSTNLDVYNAMTFFINVQVECAPKDTLVKDLLSLRCRVVLPPQSGLALSDIKEKNLLVAKLSKVSDDPVDDFHDVIIEDADDEAVRRYNGLGKRVMVYKDDVKGKIWGLIIPLP